MKREVLRQFARLSAVVLAGLVLPAAAQAASIASYTLTNVPASGFGNWTYDSNTLNDGIIPTSENDNLLLALNSAPSINFVLDGTYNISEISILSAFQNNFIPGNLVSALVTIGANSAQVAATGFGPACTAFLCNDKLVLPGSLSSLATNSFTLSNFVAQGSFSGFTALGEVVVVGNGADVVPEPASWAMLIAGFGLVGAAMRRRAAGIAA
jgi:hypothetical protein